MGYFIRVLLLMAMGLGGMYMLHLLAQDFSGLGQPLANAANALGAASSQQLSQLWRGRRNIGPTPPYRSFYQSERRELPPQNEPQLALNRTLPSIDWKRILSHDPFECLQSLICQLMSGAEGGQSREALLIMDVLESTLTLAPAKIGRAFSRGLALHGVTERCYDEYPFCLYSAKTMLRVLRWFTSDDEAH